MPIGSAAGPASAEAVVAGYRPGSVPAEAAAFARLVVAASAPKSPVRARTLLWTCSRLAAFGLSVGLEPTAEVLLHPSVIERFISVGMRAAPVGRQRDVRTNLRFVARRAAPRLQPPAPLPLARSRAKLPYTDAEIDAYLGLADAQPTVGRRMRLSALVCLGAGAGCSGPDLRHVRGRDISRRDGGMVVAVDGPRARVVPVLARYQDRLGEAARFAGSGYLIGGRVPHRHNLTDRLVATAAGGIDLPRLEPARLRVTWLAVQAARLGLPGLFEAAGFVWSKQLGDIVAGLAPPSPGEAITLLGASG